MGRMGFYYDQTRCVGCNACQIACKDYHDLEAGLVYRRVSTWEMEEGDELICLHYSGACNHCSDPLCVKNCPVQAISIQADGTVVQDKNACIGCGTCTWVCPYGAPSLSRMSGTAVKCNGCAERRAEGKEPVCVEACITHCLQFGDLDELSKGVETVRDLPILPKSDLTDPAIAIRPCKAFNAEETKPAMFGDTDKEEVSDVSLKGKKLLILGGGIAGVTAAEQARKLSSDLAITMISDEEELPYSRPLLSKTYLKSLDASKIQLKPESWYEENKVELILGRKIVKLDTVAKKVLLEDGSETAFDACVYALGASPWTPPMEGLPMKGVQCVRTAEDMDAIHTCTAVAKNAIVLGGGVIGLEMAEELRAMGLSVTILEAAPRLMGRLLDAESSKVLKDHLIEEGMQVEEGVSVVKAEAGPSGRLAQVVLKDGRVFPAEVMVVSCGIRANIALASEAGLCCERGVVVDGTMKTSAANVYGAGDCISLNGRNPGLWGFSKDTAEMAGRNAVLALAGMTITEEPYRFVPDVMMSTSGISIFSYGSLEEGEGVEISYGRKEERKEMQEFAAEAGNASGFLVNHRSGEGFSYQKYYRKNGRLVGAVLMGDLSMLAEVKKSLKEVEAQV